MKTIGIIGAMEEEVHLLISKIEIVSIKNIVGVDFHMGKMHGNNVIIVRCGIGKVNAAICTQILIDMYGTDYIINIGVAGSIHNELEICDVVISDVLNYHDMDATGIGYKIGEIPSMPYSEFKADNELIHIAKEVGDEHVKDNKVYIGRITSGDKFIASKEDKSKIWMDFKSYCVEMEGAAIAHTCSLNMIPFVVIRAISDKADDLAEETYDKSMNLAVNNTSLIAEKIVERIN